MRAVAVRTDERYFVCPDNGILSFVLRDLDHCYVAPSMTTLEYQSRGVSSTFHGRDIFAHAAGHLANGVEALIRIWAARDAICNSPNQTVDCGTVIHIDRFGNLITNLRRAGSAGRAFDRGGWPGHQAARFLLAGGAGRGLRARGKHGPDRDIGQPRLGERRARGESGRRGPCR